jgi:hypothetical protein
MLMEKLTLESSTDGGEPKTKKSKIKLFKFALKGVFLLTEKIQEGKRSEI